MVNNRGSAIAHLFPTFTASAVLWEQQTLTNTRYSLVSICTVCPNFASVPSSKRSILLR
jgi:hypothetical protein